MTTTANPPQEVVVEEQKTDNVIARLDKDGMLLELLEIKDGVNKGFKFWSKTYKTLQDAIAHFTKLSAGGKPGEKLVLALVNAALDFRMRSRATAKLTKSGKDVTVADKAAFAEEKKKWLKDPEASVVISQEDAENYVPGEREVSALSGLLRLKTELIKAIKAAKDAGNIDEAKAQAVKYHETVKRIDEEQKKEAEDILAML